MKKLQLCDQNHGLSPLHKCKFFGCLKPMFWLFTKACLLSKTFKIVFLRFIFTIYEMGIQGVTRGYKRLQRVTWGYKGLQAVTRGYRRLKGVTTGDRGLQGVIGSWKG